MQNLYLIAKSSGRVQKLKQIGSFFIFRLLSGVIDVAIMHITVTILGMNDSIMKLASNVVIVIVNYIFSKLIIFNKRKAD